MAEPQPIANSGNAYIDSLLTGYRWDNGNLTYSFPDSGIWYVLQQVVEDLSITSIIDIAVAFAENPEISLVNLLEDLILGPLGDSAIVSYFALNDFGEFTASQKAAGDRAIANANSFAGLNVTKIDEGDFHFEIEFDELTGLIPVGIDFGFDHAIIRYAESGAIQEDAPGLGIPPLPNAQILVGEGVLGDTWYLSDGTFDDAPVGSFSAFTIMHETGHALGLKHAHEAGLLGGNVPAVVEDLLTGVSGPIMPADKLSIQYSIMSYRAALGGPDTLSAAPGNFAQSFMMLDIQALQYMYGAKFEGGNTTYWFDSDSGEMKVDGNSNGVPGINKLFLTVWDGNGNDTYDFSDYDATEALTIDLAPGGYSITTLAQRADLDMNDDDADTLALGNVYNALQYNNNTSDLRSLIENAKGGGGADSIKGNIAANKLEGGGGADTILGLVGADTLNGDDGADSLDGGLDNDEINGGGGNDTLIGADGNDLLDGGGDNDTVSGGVGNDTVKGGDGNDTLNGGTGDDRMEGGNGDDLFLVDTLGDQVIEGENGGLDTIRTAISIPLLPDNVENLDYTGNAPLNIVGNDSNNSISGGLGNDSVSGQGGNDTLVGNNGYDVLSGDSGDDQLFGGVGNDLLDGGADNDLVEGGTGDDQIGGGTGNDTLRGGANNDYVDGDVGNDAVDGGDGFDQVSGGAGNDTVWGGSGNDLADGGTGHDTVYGETGDDQVSGGDGDDFVSGGANNDYVDGGIGDDIVNGDEGNDQISGGDGDDAVDGGAGNDQADGGTGEDTVSGGEGNDQITGGANDDRVYAGAGNDQADGGSGNDTVTGDEGDDAVTGGTGNDNVSGGTGLDNVDGGDGDDTVDGNDGNDTITGGIGNDTLSGGAGNDSVSGGDGDDLIREGGGSDKIDGGAGIDTVDYSASTVGIVFSPLAYGLYGDALGDQLLNIEKLYGTNFADTLYLDTADNSLYGLGGNDKLYGLAGNDFLDGGTGADTMTGSTGDDVYIVDNTGDSVIELNNQGRDRVETYLNYYVLGLYVEDLTFIGTGNFTGIGNILNNSIVGGAGTDLLKGESGDDTLVGLGGIDTMYGGSGNDTYYVDNTSDKALENKSEGTDIVFSSATYTLSSNVENLTLLEGSGDINGTGNDLNNILVGNSGNNILDGAAGCDTMSGNGGNDTFIVDNSADKVIEAIGDGNDAVKSSVSFVLGVGQEIETLILTGTANIDGTGNEFVNTIIGNSGKNVLNGGGDADILTGGLGDDIYVVDNAGDQTIETNASGSGYDTVKSTITWSLALTPYIEALCLLGSANIDGTGNDLANAIFGNSGKNVLDGGLGADTMLGDGGDDTYVVDNAGDKAIEASSSGGTDLVLSGLTYTLGSYLDNLTLTGTGNINGTGNSANNAITGNDGNNQLDGSSGADTMTGLGGNDTYIVDNSGDKVYEAPGGGTDTVKSSVSYALLAGQEIETLVLGSSDINGTGNEFANVITGTSGKNVIDGGGGADTMTGFNGDDTYVVDDALDVIVETSTGGNDTVKSSLTYSLLGTNLESLVLLGTGDIDGTGGATGNALTGNSGKNVLDGGTGADTMTGLNGDDTYVVDNSGDKVIEGTGAGSGIDLVLSSVTFSLAGQGAEKLTLTGAGSINGTGNTLANEIVGNAGANKLYGDLGNDTLTGGTGFDGFVFNTALNAATNVDTIVDFSVADDTIYLDKSVFKAFGSTGTLASSAFNIGAAAADSSDRITYDSATGKLFYDSNGNASGGSPVQFATLSTGLLLTNLDFQIV